MNPSIPATASSCSKAISASQLYSSDGDVTTPPSIGLWDRLALSDLLSRPGRRSARLEQSRRERPRGAQRHGQRGGGVFEGGEGVGERVWRRDNRDV